MTKPQLFKGLADPVLDSQSIFRCVLQAMARPGLVNPLPSNLVGGPQNLARGIYAAALTLLDFETPLWLCPAYESSGVAELLRFHCGCPTTQYPESAGFALLSAQSDATILDLLPTGSPEFPDQSPTVLVGVEGFALGERLNVSGPGIDGHTQMKVAGLPAGFINRRAEICDQFPLGIDVIMASDEAIACLPRTTRIAA